MGYSRKNPNTGVEDILFLKTHLEFLIFYFTPGNSRQNKAQPLDIPQECVRSLAQCRKFQDQKQKLLDIPHYFFLVIFGNSTSFLIKPW